MGAGPMCKISKDLSNKVIIITGANTGIGKESAKRFAKDSATLILACRSQERTQPVVEELQKEFPKAKIEFMKLDLSDLDSVLEFSNQFKQKYNKLDILLNNAGVMMPNKRELSKQNYELQLGTNHFGHFVLTNQLLSHLKVPEQSRIVNVSSMAHDDMMGNKGKIHFDNLNFDAKYVPAEAYAQSKLANILFTKKLQNVLNEKKQKIKVVTLHPGVIDSELSRHMFDGANFFKKGILKAFYAFTLNVEQGAQTQIHCCLEDQEKLIDGAYYDKSAVKVPSKLAQDDQLADKFWDLSNKLVDKKYLLEW